MCVHGHMFAHLCYCPLSAVLPKRLMAITRAVQFISLLGSLWRSFYNNRTIDIKEVVVFETSATFRHH